jgi:DNA-directed RNA polymerase specialized sigma24 family protein
VDDADFREFVELRYGDLLRTAYLLTGSRDAAQDLVQDALLKVMRR